LFQIQNSFIYFIHISFRFDERELDEGETQKFIEQTRQNLPNTNNKNKTTEALLKRTYLNEQNLNNLRQRIIPQR
jgi:hypothetical protein